MKNKSQTLGRVFLWGALLALAGAVGCTSDKGGSSQSTSGGNAADSIGIGPITAKLTIDPKIDTVMANKGKAMFEARCTACHKFEAKYVGPALAGVTKRRRPEWIMNMILNPSEMIEKDDTAKALLAEHLSQMANQNLTQVEARSVLELFRQRDSETK